MNCAVHIDQLACCNVGGISNVSAVSVSNVGGVINVFDVHTTVLYAAHWAN